MKSSIEVECIFEVTATRIILNHEVKLLILDLPQSNVKYRDILGVLLRLEQVRSPSLLLHQLLLCFCGGLNPLIFVLSWRLAVLILVNLVM